MLIAARNAMMAGGRWKNPYVTDGLVAMWDGEWNAGGGVHDPDATMLKDLSGNGHDLVWTPGTEGVSFGANFLTLTNGNKTAYEVARTYYSLTTATTVEMVSSYDWKFNDIPANIQSIMTVIGTTVPVSRYRCHGINGWCAGKVRAYQAATGSLAVPSVEIHSVSVFGPSNVGAREDTAFSIDGVDTFWMCNYTENLDTTNPTVKLVRPPRADAKMYNTRLYSRALTAEEIAANYAVDKARFGLP